MENHEQNGLGENQGSCPPCGDREGPWIPMIAYLRSSHPKRTTASPEVTQGSLCQPVPEPGWGRHILQCLPHYPRQREGTPPAGVNPVALTPLLHHITSLTLVSSGSPGESHSLSVSAGLHPPCYWFGNIWGGAQESACSQMMLRLLVWGPYLRTTALPGFLVPPEQDKSLHVPLLWYLPSSTLRSMCTLSFLFPSRAALNGHLIMGFHV